MAKISKLTANKRGIERTISSSVEANVTTLDERLEKKLFPNGQPPNLTMGIVASALTDLLNRSYFSYEVADRDVARETAQDRRLRMQRESGVTNLRQCVIGTRSVVEGHWGSDAVSHVGLQGTTPDQPDELVTFASNVEEKLRQGFDEFKPMLAIDPPDTTALADEIARYTEVLSDVLEALQLDVRETQDAQNARNQAADEWSANYVPVATIVQHLYRLADMPAHAQRVRPTSRRRSGLPEEEDLAILEGDEDIEVVDDVDDTEEDVVVM